MYNCLLTLTKRSAERNSAQARFYGCCFSTVRISKYLNVQTFDQNPKSYFQRNIAIVLFSFNAIRYFGLVIGELARRATSLKAETKPRN